MLIAAAVVLLGGLPAIVSAASKPHVIVFGKWTTIKLLTGPEENEPLDLKIRPLFEDGKLREYTFGMPHEITERLFVVRRILRVNDALPEEPATTAHWSWQRDGWLLADRETGHIALINLPGFDSDNSSAAWYRDYVAYCGASDDDKKLLAVVLHLGSRKPVLKKKLAELTGEAQHTAPCAPPVWQRHPSRVTFAPSSDHAFTFVVRGRSVEAVNDGEDDEAGTE